MLILKNIHMFFGVQNSHPYGNLYHITINVLNNKLAKYKQISDKISKLRYNLHNFPRWTSMPNIYIKLKNISETVYFQSIMGTYSHIAWVRTQDPENGIMQVTPTEDQVDQVKQILESLKKEIEFEDIDSL